MIGSPEWERRKAELRGELADAEARRHVLIGLLRSFENEEAKAAADSKGD